ncbi:MAG: cytidylyltransferase domain-containing protein [Pseudonocardiaceae bacterium]
MRVNAVRVNVIVQARLSSTRLPGKVLRLLGGRSVLGWAVRAAHQVPGVDTVVVATSTNPEDDAVAEEARRCGAAVVRGPLRDVLGRFGTAVREHPCDAVVRLTADCPLLDPDLIGQLVALWRADPTLDYVSNVLVRTLPRGLDAELVRCAVLDEQRAQARGADRVHVTSGIYTRPERYRCAGLVVAPDSSDLRVTLDTEADLAVLEGLVSVLGTGVPGWRAVVAALRARPELAALNAGIDPKPSEAG